MSKVRRTLFGSRRRKATTLVAAAVGLLVSIGAAAAIILYAGAGGTATGKIEAGTTQKALVLSNDGAAPDLVKGATTDVPVKLTNSDPNVAHSLVSAGSNITLSTTPSNCAASLSYPSFPAGWVGVSIAPGASVSSTLRIVVAPTLPDTCATATWTATLVGTTSP